MSVVSLSTEKLLSWLLGIGSLILVIGVAFSPPGSTISSKSSKAITPIDVKSYTLQEVVKHNLPTDCWLVIQDRVYDVTAFIAEHPGGPDKIINYCGQDATVAFLTKGGRGQHSDKAIQLLNSFLIGKVQS